MYRLRYNECTEKGEAAMKNAPICIPFLSIRCIPVNQHMEGEKAIVYFTRIYLYK